jgi:hypothetical protein
VTRISKNQTLSRCVLWDKKSEPHLLSSLKEEIYKLLCIIYYLFTMSKDLLQTMASIPTSIGRTFVVVPACSAAAAAAVGGRQLIRIRVGLHQHAFD